MHTADVVVDLEQLIADKVHQRIEAMNGTVEEIVAREVDREIGRRIAELLEAELDGRVKNLTADAPDTATNGATAVKNLTAKTCVGCGESKAAGEYERGRNRCRSCRRRQVAESRQRRQQQQEADDQERPRSDGQAS